jgi:hypothetical protein
MPAARPRSRLKRFVATLRWMLASILALFCLNGHVIARDIESPAECGGTEPCQVRKEVVITCGDEIDRKCFEHKQKIRAWYRAHGWWAPEVDKRSRIWMRDLRR